MFAARRLGHGLGFLVLASSMPGCGGFGGAGSGSGSIAASSSLASGSTAPATIPSNVSLRQLVVETDRLAISKAGYVQQLQVSGVFSDGRVRDLTSLATWTAQDPTVARVDARAVVTPLAAGTTGLQASWGGLTATATLEVKASAVAPGSMTTPAAAAGPTWRTDVFPLFQRTLNCRGCHTAAGPGKMKLALVEATDYATFTTTGLIDKANPGGSLVLQKGCGTVSHGGAAAMKAGGPEAMLIQSWIAGGAPLAAGASAPPPPAGALPTPDAVIVNPGERNMVDPRARQQLVVVAWWRATNETADVTRSALLSLSSAAIATVDSDGILTATGAGILDVTASWQGVRGTARLELGSSASLARGDSVSMLTLPVAGPGAGAPTGTPATPPATTPPPPTGPFTYAAHIAPIMNVSCTRCHDGSIEFSLLTYAAVSRRVVPGNSANSELVKETRPGAKMAVYITPSDAAILKQWVDQGAKP